MFEKHTKSAVYVARTKKSDDLKMRERRKSGKYVAWPNLTNWISSACIVQTCTLFKAPAISS